MLDKIQVHAVSIQYATQTDLHVYNMYMYLLLNLLGKESCFCIIHTCISWSVDHAHKVMQGSMQFFRYWNENLSKGLAFGSLLGAHDQMFTKSIVYSIKLIPMK